MSEPRAEYADEDYHCDFREIDAHGQPTTAVVLLNDVPIRVFEDEDRAREWVEGLPSETNLTVWWPVLSPEVVDE